MRMRLRVRPPMVNRDGRCREGRLGIFEQYGLRRKQADLDGPLNPPKVA